MERQGVVRLREEVQVELPWHRYTASWQPSPDGPEESFYSVDGPGWNEVEEAIKWARRHAPIVYVRLGQGLSEIYNAGESDGGRAAGQGRRCSSRLRRRRLRG